ncbi:MAG TPA: hypothetical protein VMW10_12540 [Alphaproteobacteria bacterium]|nr:hypothetical protein [Alphaproteobacteria bacterium]
MARTKKSKIAHRYPFQYKGNILLFVLCIIIFFPVGIILAIKNGMILKDNKFLALSYRGSYGWLIFWAVVFFPIAFVLLLINGIDVVEGE